MDEKTYGIASALTVSDVSPSVDLVVTYPDRTVKLYSGITRLADRKYKGRVALENFGDFNFDGTFETAYQTVDNFYLKMDLNSPKIKLDRVHIEINAKQNAAGAKGIEFMAAAADKNMLSGFADYSIKEEKGKTIIEGTGNVKLYDKEKLASFKFVRNNFEEGRDGETGVQVSGGVGIGAGRVELSAAQK